MNTLPLSPPPVVRTFTAALDGGKLSMVVEETVTTTYRILSIDAVAPPVVPPVVQPTVTLPPVGGDVLVSTAWLGAGPTPGFTNGTNPDGTLIGAVGVNDHGSVRVIDRPGSLSGKTLEFTIDTEALPKRPEGEGARILDYQTLKDMPEFWATVWMFFPDLIRVRAGGFMNIMQCKSAGPGAVNDPTIILNVGNRDDGQMRPYVWDWTAKKGYSAAPDVVIPVGRPVRFDLHYIANAAPTGGFTIWQDKRQILSASGIVTKPHQGLAFGVSAYSDGALPVPTRLHLDGIVVRRTRPVDLPPVG